MILGVGGHISKSAPEWQALMAEMVRMGLRPWTGSGILYVIWKDGYPIIWETKERGKIPRLKPVREDFA